MAADKMSVTTLSQLKLNNNRSIREPENDIY